MHRTGTLITAIVLFVLGCHAPVDPQEEFRTRLETRNWPIVGGHTTTDWESVLMILTDDGICTSTLVSPDVVLTAAHCLDGHNGPLEVYWCNDCYGSGYWDMQTSSNYEQHPHWNDQTMAGDVAVIMLNQNGSSEPIPVNRDDASYAWLGQSNPLTSVGFGVTEEHLNNSGTKREVESAVQSWDGTFLYYEDPDHSICFGDSGGPALTDHTGIWRVAGVHSWVTGDCHDIGASIQVDNYASWVDGYTGNWTPDDDDDDAANDDDDQQGDDDQQVHDDQQVDDDHHADDDDDDQDPDDDDAQPADDDVDVIPGEEDLPSPRTNGEYGAAQGMSCVGDQAAAPAGPAWFALLGLTALLLRRAG